MKTTTTWNGSGKMKSRDFIFAGCTPLHDPLFLPGAEMADVRLAMRLGLVGNHTRRITLAENIPAIRAAIERQLADLPIAPICHMHAGDLETLAVTHPVDFAHIDLIGHMNARLVRWIEALPTTENATVCVTVTRKHRHNALLDHFAKIVHEHPVLRFAADMACDIASRDANIVAAVCLFAWALAPRSFQAIRCFNYSDIAGRRMLVMKAIGVSNQGLEKPFPLDLTVEPERDMTSPPLASTPGPEQPPYGTDGPPEPPLTSMETLMMSNLPLTITRPLEEAIEGLSESRKRKARRAVVQAEQYGAENMVMAGRNAGRRNTQDPQPAAKVAKPATVAKVATAAKPNRDLVVAFARTRVKFTASQLHTHMLVKHGVGVAFSAATLATLVRNGTITKNDDSSYKGLR